jgi:hypothetical protein
MYTYVYASMYIHMYMSVCILLYMPVCIHMYMSVCVRMYQPRKESNRVSSAMYMTVYLCVYKPSISHLEMYIQTHICRNIHKHMRMYVCMYVCMYVWMYTCTYTQTHAYVCVYQASIKYREILIPVSMYVNMHMYVYVCVYVSAKSWVSRGIDPCMYVCMYVHMQMYVHKLISGIIQGSDSDPATWVRFRLSHFWDSGSVTWLRFRLSHLTQIQTQSLESHLQVSFDSQSFELHDVDTRTRITIVLFFLEKKTWNSNFGPKLHRFGICSQRFVWLYFFFTLQKRTIIMQLRVGLELAGAWWNGVGCASRCCAPACMYVCMYVNNPIRMGQKPSIVIIYIKLKPSIFIFFPC